MDALVMCGGRGTRLDAPVEKPLYEIGGRPMIDRVLEALAEPAETTHAVVSPHAPETAAHVDVPTIETAGEGYVSDLRTALSTAEQPVLTVAADLPLLTDSVVSAVLDAHERGSLSVSVPAGLKRDLGVSVDTTVETADGELAPTGLNVVGEGPERRLVLEDERLAVNVNRPADARIAEERL
ncbi:GTP:adenosylcobinamide-phosphate guanylyltransferase [Halapricum desulfuricans]|uniref:GTP:adenosylcobinamide-phosphate guanylyltransferase n=2 Tax=Halapricum desulfuricans TaxID=2841257 RepID=A0A897N6Z4_9EURY|nr:GTP:adenosylcobinamide-phosphate guanylyltransferase [Halapricum desulfuricans]